MTYSRASSLNSHVPEFSRGQWILVLVILSCVVAFIFFPGIAGGIAFLFLVPLGLTYYPPLKWLGGFGAFLSYLVHIIPLYYAAYTYLRCLYLWKKAVRENFFNAIFAGMFALRQLSRLFSYDFRFLNSL